MALKHSIIPQANTSVSLKKTEIHYGTYNATVNTNKTCKTHGVTKPLLITCLNTANEHYS